MTRHYRSRSEIVLALVLAAVNAGWGEDAIYRALADPRHTGGTKVREILARRGERAAREYVARCYRRALQRVRESPPTHDGAEAGRAAVARLDTLADAHAWPGMAGATDRHVLRAHWQIATAIGCATYGAADREIAERAGVSRSTIGRSHRRLLGQGWLHRVRVGRTGPSTWTLAARRHLTPLSSGPTDRGGRMKSGGSYRHGSEYWRWRGIGGRGAGLATARVYGALRDGMAGDVRHLAAVLGMRTSTVRHHLRRLRADGIMQAGMWALVPDVDEALVRAAARRGTLGSDRLQRARHREERQAYRRARQEHRRLQDDVLRLAEAAGWRTLRLGARLLLAPGERAWRAHVAAARTRELRLLRDALGSATEPVPGQLREGRR